MGDQVQDQPDALAPDYWYLRWFDAKAMEPFVDWFGFMAYDLHGSWDADTKTLGKKVRGQADIREISNDTVPLWFDYLDPQKINFGMALYGRGYTVESSSCNSLLCPFREAKQAGEMHQLRRNHVFVEIQQLIDENKDVKSECLPEAMMKQITWDDQWIGYDDEETIRKKREWADSKCFGGTMFWSIDFQVPGIWRVSYVVCTSGRFCSPVERFSPFLHTHAYADSSRDQMDPISMSATSEPTFTQHILFTAMSLA